MSVLGVRSSLLMVTCLFLVVVEFQNIFETGNCTEGKVHSFVMEKVGY